MRCVKTVGGGGSPALGAVTWGRLRGGAHEEGILGAFQPAPGRAYTPPGRFPAFSSSRSDSFGEKTNTDLATFHPLTLGLEIAFQRN